MEHQAWLESAELYALGALDGGELTRFEAHVPDCSVCRERIEISTEAIALVPQSLVRLAAPVELNSRISTEIADETPAYRFVHAAEGDWQELAPGIVAKVLHLDPSRQCVTALVRMAPGSRYIDHRHRQAEELYVLPGG